MIFSVYFFVICLILEGNFVASEVFPLGSCDVTINYPHVWKSKLSDPDRPCLILLPLELCEGLEELCPGCGTKKCKLNVVPSERIAFLLRQSDVNVAHLAVKCVYEEMYKWFELDVELAKMSLFYLQPVPEKPNVLDPATGALKIAIYMVRFKTTGIGTETISPFNPEGGEMTKKANEIWQQCAEQADKKFETLYSSATTVLAKPKKPEDKETKKNIHNLQYGVFGHCIYNKTTELVNDCLTNL